MERCYLWSLEKLFKGAHIAREGELDNPDRNICREDMTKSEVVAQTLKM